MSTAAESGRRPGGSLQVVSQLHQLIGSVPVDVSMFERAMRMVALDRDAQGGADVWNLLDSVQPPDQLSITKHRPARGTAPASLLPPTPLPDTFPRAVTYSLGIQSICVLGKETTREHSAMAVHLFRRAMQLQYRVDGGAYKCLLGALSGHGSPEVTGAQEVFDCLLTASTKPGKNRLTVTAELCGYLMYAWNRAPTSTPRLAAVRDAAIARISRIMQKFSLQSDAGINSNLIRLAVGKGDIAEAERITQQILATEGSWPDREAVKSMLEHYFNSSDPLTASPKFEALLLSMQSGTNKKKAFQLTPEQTEWRIEAACRYQIALRSQPSHLDADQQIAALLEPLCLVLRIFTKEGRRLVFHKLTYMHIFYAITQVSLHQHAMRTGRPYDARPLAAVALAARKQQNSATPSTPSPSIPTTLASVADPHSIALECLGFSVPRLLKSLTQSMNLCTITALPAVYIFSFHFLIECASNEDDVTSLLYLLDDFLLLSLHHHFASQAVLTPPDRLQPMLREFTTSPASLAYSDFPPPDHALHQLCTKQMTPATFLKFFRTQLVQARHKSRACTVEEQAKKTPQLGKANPVHTGEAALGEMAFMLLDIQRRISPKPANSPQPTPAPATQPVPSVETSLAAVVDNSTPVPAAASAPTEVTLYLSSRLLAMTVVMKLLGGLYARSRGAPHHTTHVAQTGGMPESVLVSLLVGVLDRATTYGVLSEILRGGDTGERIMSLLLQVRDAHSVAITLFNDYRSKLRQDEMAGRIQPDAAARQLYRPVLLYLAQQNQLDAWDALFAELETTGSPLFHPDHLFRGECVMRGLRGDSTKILQDFRRIMHLEPAARDPLLNRETMAIIVEALDRCEDERAIAELLATPDTAAYLVRDQSILQLVIRALVRLDAFAPAGHAPTGHKLERAVRLLTEHWGAPLPTHTRFLLQMLKCALMVHDEASAGALLAFFTQHRGSLAIAATSDNTTPIHQFEWSSARAWQECVVPYPHILFRPSVSVISATVDPATPSSRFHVPLTHPSAMQLHEFHRDELQRVASTGDLASTMRQLAQLHQHTLEAEVANQGLNVALSKPIIDQIHSAQDQCVEVAVRNLAKHALTGEEEATTPPTPSTRPVQPLTWPVAPTSLQRSFHTTRRVHLLDAQTHEAAKSWNVAARLGTAEELVQLEAWLKSFKRDDIPSHSFELIHARSSGKGGQNVNKVNTKVDMRFRLDAAHWLPSLARRCLREQERGRLNTAGEFVITSERTRTQGENFADCVDKLFAMIRSSCELPKATDAAKIERVKKLGDAEKARRRQSKDFQRDKKASRRDWRD